MIFHVTLDKQRFKSKSSQKYFIVTQVSARTHTHYFSFIYAFEKVLVISVMCSCLPGSVRKSRTCVIMYIIQFSQCRFTLLFLRIKRFLKQEIANCSLALSTSLR